MYVLEIDHTCMYACIHVCIYMRVYVGVFVCVNVYLYANMHGITLKQI